MNLGIYLLNSKGLLLVLVVIRFRQSKEALDHLFRDRFFWFPTVVVVVEATPMDKVFISIIGVTLVEQCTNAVFFIFYLR